MGDGRGSAGGRTPSKAGLLRGIAILPYVLSDPYEALGWLDVLFGAALVVLLTALAFLAIGSTASFVHVGWGPLLLLPYIAWARAALRRWAAIHQSRLVRVRFEPQAPGICRPAGETPESGVAERARPLPARRVAAPGDTPDAALRLGCGLPAD